MYLIAATAGQPEPSLHLYGINASTGAIAGGPVPIPGSPSNDSSITFNAAPQCERPGLLLMNGSVYAAFGSHCDWHPYVGLRGRASTSPPSAMTLWTDETGLTDNQAGIWQSGGGLMSDGDGADLLHLRQRSIPGGRPRHLAAGATG